mmetsp:Transcript_58743/g.182178  ORF Transcript_58743/g.182178 Transcript_58743/m.182178 type:complete len:255 (-) Transcript_58743:1444-2208(-)
MDLGRPRQRKPGARLHGGRLREALPRGAQPGVPHHPGRRREGHHDDVQDAPAADHRGVQPAGEHHLVDDEWLQPPGPPQVRQQDRSLGPFGAGPDPQREHHLDPADAEDGSDQPDDGGAERPAAPAAEGAGAPGEAGGPLLGQGLAGAAHAPLGRRLRVRRGGLDEPAGGAGHQRRAAVRADDSDFQSLAQQQRDGHLLHVAGSELWLLCDLQQHVGHVCDADPGDDQEGDLLHKHDGEVCDDVSHQPAGGHHQ